MALKAKLHNMSNRLIGYKERDIWICNVGENVGYEEDGKGKEFRRPVLVVKSFGKNLCHIIPLSTTEKRGRFYFPFEGKTGKLSTALLSQSRSIDTARLRKKIGYISKEDFMELKRAYFSLLQ
jgi:mRNA interferase MazF